MSIDPIHIVGGGLAGSEAAWQVAQAGVPVVLHEMRPVRGTDAHKTEGLAELVCSNSFRSDDAETNAVGLLHAEMRLAGSLIMASGDASQVPAGGALAVDRDGFSAAVTAKIEAHPLITVMREEISGLPPADWDQAIIATGPLTAPSLAQAIRTETGADSLAFFDAIAPIVHFDTIDGVRRLASAVWVAHGSRDLIIPVRMGREVYEAAAVKGGLLIVEAAGHNDVPQAGGQAYWNWLAGAVIPPSGSATDRARAGMR